ncbi:hypothetical protein SFC65_20275 [Priestia filamentosa]|uniref:hypothetical protein n=1 Tax=Priestia filamentosa TaxID=1402861 RepID=UPI003982D403
MTKPSYQVFKSEEELNKYIINEDPMKEFHPSKREINWEITERECFECGTEFRPEHPAQMFCTVCQTKENKENKRNSVVVKMKEKSVIANCAKCGSKFYKTAPAMRNCSKCTERGGERVSPKE